MNQPVKTIKKAKSIRWRLLEKYNELHSINKKTSEILNEIVFFLFSSNYFHGLILFTTLTSNPFEETEREKKFEGKENLKLRATEKI